MNNPRRNFRRGYFVSGFSIRRDSERETLFCYFLGMNILIPTG